MAQKTVRNVLTAQVFDLLYDQDLICKKVEESTIAYSELKSFADSV